MRINLVGAVIRNAPFATELAFKRGFDRLAVHKVSYIDPDYPNQQWDYDADATIVFKQLEGDENIRNLELCKGKKIVYQPDDIRFPHIKVMMEKIRKHCSYAFTFENCGARIAVDELGYLKAERLLLTADDELYRPLPDVEKDIDVCFVGSLTGGFCHRSRVRMCQIVSKLQGVLGIRCALLSDVYNIEELNKIYNRSKIVLNHATDVGQRFGFGFGYQCRHFEVGFTSSCLLSNVIDEPFREIAGFYQYGSEKELIEKVVFLLSNPEKRIRAASDLYLNLMTAHKPEHRAQQMINFVESL